MKCNYSLALVLTEDAREQQMMNYLTREQMMLTQLARDYMNGRQKMENYNNNYSLALVQLADEDRTREEKKKEEEEDSRITRAHSVFVKGAEKKERVCIACAHLEVEMKSWESACIARALIQKKLKVQSRERAPKGERALKQNKLSRVGSVRASRVR